MLIRPCILVIEGHSSPLQRILEDCILNTPFPVVLVGYEEKNPLFHESKTIQEALKEKRLSIVPLKGNQGRGLCIQAGIRCAVKMGYTHLVTFETNGSFKAEVLQSLVHQALETPWNLIIGVCKSSETVTPKSSRWLRQFARFQEGSQEVSVRGAQSGWRVYPLFFVQCMKFWAKGSRFEMEVLLRLLWKKVEVTEMPVLTAQKDQKEKSGWFRNFWDGVGISLLNLWLVFLSLLKEHRSPKQAAVALGLGVFVGCTPFFGFHTLIVLLLAPLLRLNALFLWIGTQISLPPLAPLLAFVSVNIGLALMGETTVSRSNPWTLKLGLEFFSYWVLGSVILGAILAILTMGLAYFISIKFLKRGAPYGAWHGKIRGGRIGHGFLKWLFRRGGLRPAVLLLYLLVPYFYLFAPRARRASLEYWRTVKPESNPLRIRGMVLKHFFRYGVLLLEQAYKNSGANEGLKIESEGYENIRAFSNGSTGGILLNAHVGAWNMALSLLADSERINPFVFLQFESEALTFNKTHVNPSGPSPVFFYVNEKESPILGIYSLLKSKKVLGIMGDRPLGKDYELVPFFGKLAVFDKTPFLISAVVGVPMLSSFGFWKNFRTFRFFASEAKHYRFTEGQDRQTEVYSWLKDYVATLEKSLQGNLDQWFNFFPFWSEKPSPPLSLKTKRERHHLCLQANKEPPDLSGWESDESRSCEPGFQWSRPPGELKVKFE